jgi:hypothetical protein
MDVELTVPQTPVSLAPGVATRVPVKLHNPFGRQLSVRVSVTRGRAAGWATVEPVSTVLEPGATATVEVVLQVPADQPSSPSLVPFTVAAQELSTGAPAGYASGLLRVARPVPVVGELVGREGRPHTYDLRLANDSDRPAAVRISTRLDPPLGSAAAEPAAVRLEPGGSLTAEVRARPARPLFGTPKPYAVLVDVRDAADPDGPPLLAEVGTGIRRPRVANWVAGTVAILLALGATAAVALSGVRLPAPGGNRKTPAPPAQAAPVAPAVTPVTVARPYALIEVLPHRGADGGKAAAEAEQVKLAAAGMPVRLVDSLASDVLADEGAGFWVLLQDGFATPDAATAYCTQWRLAAPKCTVIP